jgi:hypothetical protein
LKRQDYRTRVAKTLNFEEHIFSEFEELCKEENVYPSHKLQQLMIGELEKKVVGHQNPLNVSYRQEKEKLSQSEDIRQWLPRDVAIKMAADVPMDAQQWRHLGETCQIIARKIDTGYLNKNAKGDIR